MAIYAISDLHLSLASPKPMDIFGPIWADHAEKIRRNWDSTVRNEDVVLLPGDLSWAMRYSDALPDLQFVADRPGLKILTRGNHDYWWQRKATSRMQRTFDRNVVFLQGTSTMIGDIGITGTRGWRLDPESWHQTPSPALEEDAPNPKSAIRNPQSDRLILERELTYLERGLQSIPEQVRLRIVMLHYPPFDEHLKPNEFAHVLTRHAVDIVVYGHIHVGLGSWLEGEVDGVRYHLVSADIVNFAPQLIVP
jgi:uncharacterized protein